MTDFDRRPTRRVRAPTSIRSRRRARLAAVGAGARALATLDRGERPALRLAGRRSRPTPTARRCCCVSDLARHTAQPRRPIRARACSAPRSARAIRSPIRASPLFGRCERGRRAGHPAALPRAAARKRELYRGLRRFQHSGGWSREGAHLVGGFGRIVDLAWDELSHRYLPAPKACSRPRPASSPI